MAEYNDYINDIVKAKKVRFLFCIRVKDAVITLCNTEEIKLLPTAFYHLSVYCFGFMKHNLNLLTRATFSCECIETH